MQTFTDLTERRQLLFEKAAALRTKHFCLVLEDFFDPHNISAVIRTAEVFGLQNVHIIEEDNAYRVNKAILKGSLKWLNAFIYSKRAMALDELKKQGYKIAVASTHASKPLPELDLSKPTAFYLGAEFRGNHPDTLTQADEHFILPQYGLTESLNVSVAAGVLLTYLDVYMQGQGRGKFSLSQEEQEALILEWRNRHLFGNEKFSPVQRVGIELS
ncbi:MAG: RNA methyltransferase [Fibromonadaceae bacterium]|jgi:tRNA (guanosine-2'-O-)-methyltransferase|nr:RNA methyltransferase [Fibromonadaceae bacterium]